MQAHPLTALLLAFSSPFVFSPSTFALSFPRPGNNNNSNRSSRSASRDSLHHARRNRYSHHGGQSQQQEGRNSSMGDCHSTLQNSNQQNTQSESFPLSSTRTEPSAWVLPPIPTFEELGLRFDRSRTSSMNAIVENERPRAESQQQQQQQEQQMQDQRDIHRGVTNALQAAESSSNGVYESGSGCHWSGEHAAGEDDNVLDMPDVIPDSQPSIFDEILSDDNEAYIIWSTPSTRTKQQATLSTSTAGPSSGGVSSVAALPESAKHPAGSDASSLAAAAAAAATTHHQQQPSSSLDKGAASAGQDRSTKKRWSTIEPLNVRIKEANRSTDTLNSFGQSKPTKQDGSSTTTNITATTTTSGSNLRPPKTPTTAVTTATTTAATELQQKNRVIMAATVEKLVEKLTSEIGKLSRWDVEEISTSLPLCPSLSAFSHFFPRPFGVSTHLSSNPLLVWSVHHFLIHLCFFELGRLHVPDGLFPHLPTLHHTNGTPKTHHRPVPLGSSGRLPSATDCTDQDICYPTPLAPQLL